MFVAGKEAFLVSVALLTAAHAIEPANEPGPFFGLLLPGQSAPQRTGRTEEIRDSRRERRPAFSTPSRFHQGQR